MNNGFKKAITKVVTGQDNIVLADGKKAEEGTRLIRGVYCPQCKTWYPMAIRISACNACGWKAKKTLKPHEYKKYVKQMGRADRNVNPQKAVV